LLEEAISSDGRPASGTGDGEDWRALSGIRGDAEFASFGSLVAALEASFVTVDCRPDSGGKRVQPGSCFSTADSIFGAEAFASSPGGGAPELGPGAGSAGCPGRGGVGVEAAVVSGGLAAGVATSGAGAGRSVGFVPSPSAVFFLVCSRKRLMISDA
jgi:hypothetical protein